MPWNIYFYFHGHSCQVGWTRLGATCCFVILAAVKKAYSLMLNLHHVQIGWYQWRHMLYPYYVQGIQLCESSVTMQHCSPTKYTKNVQFGEIKLVLFFIRYEIIPLRRFIGLVNENVMKINVTMASFVCYSHYFNTELQYSNVKNHIHCKPSILSQNLL